MTSVNLQGLTLEEVADRFAAWLRSFDDAAEEAEGIRRGFPLLLRELATGRPVDPGRIATRIGVPPEMMLTALRQGPAEWDPSGTRVVGFGLTGIKTQHRYVVHGRTMWVWCATDAVAFPVLIGAPARIESPCAATGDPIRVELTPAGVERVEPAATVISFNLPSTDLAGVRQAACASSNFYRDAGVAAKWLGANPAGRLLPVADAFEVYRRAYLTVWPDLTAR